MAVRGRRMASAHFFDKVKPIDKAPDTADLDDIEVRGDIRRERGVAGVQAYEAAHRVIHVGATARSYDGDLVDTAIAAQRHAHQGIDADVAQRQTRTTKHGVALEFLAHAVDVQAQRRITLAAIGQHATVAGRVLARQAGGVHIRDGHPAQQFTGAVAGQASHGARARLRTRTAAQSDTNPGAVRACGRWTAASGWPCSASCNWPGCLRLQTLRRLTRRFFCSAPRQPLCVQARLLGRLLACPLLRQAALRLFVVTLPLGGLLSCELLGLAALRQFLDPLAFGCLLRQAPGGILRTLACLQLRLDQRILHRALRSQFTRRFRLLFKLPLKRFLIAHGLLLRSLLRLLVLGLLQLGAPACVGSVALLLLLRLLQSELLLQRCFMRRFLRRIGRAPGQRFLRDLFRFVIHDGLRIGRHFPRHNRLGNDGHIGNCWRWTSIDLG